MFEIPDEVRVRIRSSACGSEAVQAHRAILASGLSGGVYSGTMLSRSTTLPALRGGLLALMAATLFGVSTPLVQRWGVGLGPFSTAALLYAGAAVVGALSRRPPHEEARLARSDLPRLLAMAAFGAVLGPVALAWGLQRTSGTSASLMLTLEALFTALLAWRLYHETMDRRVWAAMLLLLLGGGVLVLDQARGGGTQLRGLLAVLFATAAWGVDNTLSRALAERDPSQVVMAKAALGATASAAIAALAGESLPWTPAVLALALVGAAGYGLSLRFYLLAQRAFGAARTGSVFAFAPFIGAGVAVLLGDRSAGWPMAAGGALMMAGILLHLAESHGHEHEHDPVEHEHAHRHDDGHHEHVHDTMPAGPHSHPHRHEPLRHSHPHVPDAHHTHRH
jgi:drug/metabolite transporter (DMT)-like permease